MSLGQKTIPERLALELERRLNRLVDNDTYNTQVIEVVRPKRIEDLTPKNGQIVLAVAAENRVPELDCPGNPPAVCERIIFNIQCHILNDEKSCQPVESLVNWFRADVQLAVTNGDHFWYTFGNLAMDAEFVDPSSYDSDGGMDGINAQVAITYRHTEGNLYEVRA